MPTHCASNSSNRCVLQVQEVLPRQAARHSSFVQGALALPLSSIK
jgi:hypothetical protein